MKTYRNATRQAIVIMDDGERTIIPPGAEVQLDGRTAIVKTYCDSAMLIEGAAPKPAARVDAKPKQRRKVKPAEAEAKPDAPEAKPDAPEGD